MGRTLEQVGRHEPLPPAGESDRELIASLRQNWIAETEGAHTYRALAEREKDSTRREILIEMAEAEERHAAKWARRLEALGAAPPAPAGSLSQKVRDRVIKGGGTMAVVQQMEADEDRDIARYEQQLQHLDDPESKAIIEEALAD